MEHPGSVRRWWDLWSARRDGKRDGLRGVPTAAEVAYPPALRQLQQRPDESLAALWRSWAGEDARLRETPGSAERQLATAHQRAANTARAVEQAEERHDALREQLAATQVRIAPHAAPSISLRAYRATVVAILIAEFPLNAIAFRLFGEAEVLTWVMTASLALTLVLCAHGLGTFMRAPNPTMAERRWIVMLSVLPFLTIVAIALIRERYLSAMAEATNPAALGPITGSVAFLVINLLVYLGAVMLSYLAHGPRSASTKEQAETVEDARRALRAAEEELVRTQTDVRRLDQEASRTPAQVDAALRVARATASERRSYHAQLLAAYAGANIRARSAPEIPAILRDLPVVHIPAALRTDEEPSLPQSNGHLGALDAEVLR